MENDTGRQSKQAGAALVEFALTLSLFLLVVVGIIEFSLLMMDIARAHELTRSLARMAIVSDPVCDIYGGGCPGGAGELSCPGGPPVTVSLGGMVSGCLGGSTATACRMLLLTQGPRLDIQPEQIEVTYACSAAGAAERPMAVPLVTVTLTSINYRFLFPGILGIESDLQLTGLETTRTGEDMYTETLQ